MTPTPRPLGRVPPGVRAVFFDAVGTLIHPDPPAADAYTEVGRRFGSGRSDAEVRRRFAAAFRAEEQRDFQQGLRTSELRERERWQFIVAGVLDDVSDPEGCFRELHAHFARPEAWRCETGTAAVLAALRGAGYRVGLASNFDQRLRGLAAALPPLAEVQEVVISSEVGWKKPAPAFFARLTELTALPPGQILIVGDDPGNDVEGGRAAGMQVLWFDRGAGPSAPGEGRIGSLQELIGLVSRRQWTALSDEQLLAQCEVDTYRASGPGGQKRNKTSSAVRLRHPPSGLLVIAEESRSQHENRARALRRLRRALYLKLREPIAAEELTPERLAAQPGFGPARDGEGRLHLGHKDPRFWPAVGVVLDVLAALQARLSEAATVLGTTTANLGDFLRGDDKVWEQVNQLRTQFGHKPLR